MTYLTLCRKVFEPWRMSCDLSQGILSLELFGNIIKITECREIAILTYRFFMACA